MSPAAETMGYTKENRIMDLTTPLNESLLVRQLSVREGISQLFHLNADVYSESVEIDFDQIIGRNVTIKIEMPSGAGRFFNGVVSSFCQRETLTTVTAYEMEIVPWFWFLTRTQDCRIFPEKDLKTILETVFGDLGMTDFDYQANNNPTLEYCVQYRESDFAFCSRLMEEAGVGYYFDHAERAHTLIAFDATSKHTPCPSNDEVVYGLDSAAGSAVLGMDRIEQFHMSRGLPTGKFTITDYDYVDPGEFTKPGEKLLTSAPTSIAIGGNERFEVFDYPGQFMKIDDGDELARQHAAVSDQESYQITISGGCAGFTPGHTFEMLDHPRNSYNGEYMITEVTHQITQDIGVIDLKDRPSYHNNLKCLPCGSQGVPFVPPQKTPKPVINGVQSATVVSPDGKKIDIDTFGRVCVKFPWDRSNQTTSCRVRVSQNWAGSGWGGMFFPHPGQEVLVGFMEGDPNRPVIVGRVYNAHNMPPLDPSTATQNIIRDHGGNEIVMDGDAGKERITLSSPNGDTRLNIGAGFNPDPGITFDTAWDWTRTVAGDAYDNTVGNSWVDNKGNRKILVGGDEEVHLKGAFKGKYDGISATIKGGLVSETFIGGKHAALIGGELTTNLAVKKEISKSMVRQKVAGQIKIDSQKETIIIGGGGEADDSQLLLRGGIAQWRCGDSNVVILKDDTISIISKTDVFIEALGDDIMIVADGRKVIIECDTVQFKCKTIDFGTAKLNGGSKGTIFG